MQEWEYPQELLRLEEAPHTIRRWTEDEATHAAMAEELRKQHDVLMFLLRKATGGNAPVGQ